MEMLTNFIFNIIGTLSHHIVYLKLTQCYLSITSE